SEVSCKTRQRRRVILEQKVNDSQRADLKVRGDALFLPVPVARRFRPANAPDLCRLPLLLLSGGELLASRFGLRKRTQGLVGQVWRRRSVRLVHRADLFPAMDSSYISVVRRHVESG